MKRVLGSTPRHAAAGSAERRDSRLEGHGARPRCSCRERGCVCLKSVLAAGAKCGNCGIGRHRFSGLLASLGT